MTMPLILLAIPSVFLGLFLGLPLGDSPIPSWLEPVFEQAEEMLRRATRGGVPALRHRWRADPRERHRRGIGVVLAWRLFGVTPGLHRRPGPSASGRSARRAPFLYRASLNKWWFDELNHLLFIVIGGRIANALWWFDREVVDGTVNGIGRATIEAGRGLRRVQTGRVQNYALGIAVGLIVMAGSYLISSGQR